MRATLLLPVLLKLMWFGLAAGARTDGRDQDSARDTTVLQFAQPFVKPFCGDCHGPGKPCGEVRLDGPLPDLSDPTRS